MQNPVNPVRALTEQDILLSLKAEQASIAYYTTLSDMTATTEDKHILQHIREDERRHLVMLTRIYRRLYGREPALPPSPRPTVATYEEGLSQAITDEWDAFENYRDLYLIVSDRRLRDAFFEMMTDENEHAGRLSHLYCERES